MIGDGDDRALAALVAEGSDRAVAYKAWESYLASPGGKGPWAAAAKARLEQLKKGGSTGASKPAAGKPAPAKPTTPTPGKPR